MQSEDESELSLRRKQFTKSIRRKQVDHYMQKRRLQMLATNIIFHNSDAQDQDKLQLLLQMIQQFSLKMPSHFLSSLIQMDPSLSIFYDITGFDPSYLPSFTHPYLPGHSQHKYCSSKGQQWSQRIWSSVEMDKLSDLLGVVEEWWRQIGQQVKQPLQMMYRIEDLDVLLRKEVVDFLNWVSFICMLTGVLGKIVGKISQIQSLVGPSMILGQKQGQMCLRTIHNLTACNQSRLLPFLPDILATNGLNIQMTGIYYNLFLIQSNSTPFKVKLMNYFIITLSNNCELFLAQHKQLMYIWHVGCRSILTCVGCEQCWLKTVENGLILLNSLMKVLNISYDGGYGWKMDQEREEQAFVLHLSAVLDRLTDEVGGMRCLIEQDQLITFLINNARISTQTNVMKTSLSVLNIFNKTSLDECCFYYMSTRPKMVQCLPMLLDKCLNPKYYSPSNHDQSEVLTKILLVCSNLTYNKQIAQKYFQLQLLHKTALLFYGHQGGRGKWVRIQCQYLFMNILIHIRRTFGEREVQDGIISIIFSTPESTSMFLDLFKYSPQTQKIIKKALQFVMFLVKYQFEGEDVQLITWLISDKTFMGRLKQLESINQQFQIIIQDIYQMITERNKYSQNCQQQL